MNRSSQATQDQEKRTFVDDFASVVFARRDVHAFCSTAHDSAESGRETAESVESFEPFTTA